MTKKRQKEKLIYLGQVIQVWVIINKDPDDEAIQ